MRPLKDPGEGFQWIATGSLVCLALVVLPICLGVGVRGCREMAGPARPDREVKAHVIEADEPAGNFFCRCPPIEGEE